MFKLYFSSTQLFCLIFGLIALLVAIITHQNKCYRLSLLALCLSAFGIFSFAALLDPFINLWDERFHALVAKNMMDRPFKPMLYADPVVDMAYDRWDRYHVWLHKQPLFLWQITLSFTLFGISEYALRLPSVLMGVGLVLVTYRCANLMLNREVAFLTAILLLSSSYYISLISGRQVLEHNDFAFLFYISLSLWAWLEYYYSGHKKWVYWIGIFAGGAILCKWLVGLLVYLAWGVSKLYDRKLHPKHYLDLIKALFITLLLAVPWQIYGFIYFPEVAKMVYRHNLLHFSTVLEGHNGSFWYHLYHVNRLYGLFALLLVVPSFTLFYQELKDRKLFTSLFTAVLVVYLFFSFARTKMPSFTIVVSMIIFIAFAVLFNRILKKISNYLNKPSIYKIAVTIFLMAWVVWEVDLELLQNTHTTRRADNYYTRGLTYNKDVFESLNLPSKTVLFNVYHHVEAMFYTPYVAYGFIPSEKQYKSLKHLKRPIALVQPLPDSLPEYLQNDTSILIIEEPLQMVKIK